MGPPRSLRRHLTTLEGTDSSARQASGSYTTIWSTVGQSSVQVTLDSSKLHADFPSFPGFEVGGQPYSDLLAPTVLENSRWNSSHGLRASNSQRSSFKEYANCIQGPPHSNLLSLVIYAASNNVTTLPSYLIYVCNRMMSESNAAVHVDSHRGPKDHINIRIPHCDSKPNIRGIPQYCLVGSLCLCGLLGPLF